MAINSTLGSNANSLSKNNNDLLRILTEHLPVALYQFLKYPDGRSNFIYVSNALTDLFEVMPEELLSNDDALNKRIHPEDIARVMESIDQSITTMHIWDCQFRVVLPNKGLRWIRGVARPEKLDDEGVLSNGYMEDITDQKKANDWVRYLNSALMNISESVIITDMDSKIIYGNQKVKELHGYRPDEIIGKSVDMMHVNAMGKQELSDLIHALDKGMTYTGTGLSRRKDGSTFICEYSLTPIHGDAQGTCIGVQRDITERTRIMNEIKEANERFEQLTQHSRAITWEITEDGIFNYVSGAVYTILGYEPEELIFKGNVFDLIPAAEREHIRDIFDSAWKEKKTFTNFKCRFFDKSGNIVFMLLNGIPKVNLNSSLCIYRGLALDITEKEKMERLIADESERYKTTLLSVGEGIISTDCNGSITVMNPLAEKMTGWSSQEAEGKMLSEVFTLLEEQTGNVCQSPAGIVLESGVVYQPSFETVLVSKSGSEIPVEIIAAPIKNYVGAVSGAVIVLKDFSVYREKQRQIEFLSYHDYLTGLYNRRYLSMAMKKMDKRANLPLTVMTLDVNGLKLTNDAFGHTMGDRLLCAVADILRNSCRNEDVIARLGGDEFAILLPRTDGKNAEIIKNRILQAALKKPLDTIIVSLAIGYSVKTSILDSIDSTIVHADNLMYKEKYSQGKTMRNMTIDTVLQNINSKFEQEQIHTERVSQYCFMISNALNLTEKEKAEVRLAGLLHDIGKIMIPSDLLNKPGRLTDEEFGIIKRHPETGYQILRSVDEYVTIAKYVLHHHERWDGTGYPEGLKGSDIPLQSRIIAVADAFEAMTAKRVYQKSRTVDAAKAELKRCSGTQFDPEIVRVFLEFVLSETL